MTVYVPHRHRDRSSPQIDYRASGHLDILYGWQVMNPAMVIRIDPGPPPTLWQRFQWAAMDTLNTMFDAFLFATAWTLLTMPFWNR